MKLKLALALITIAQMLLFLLFLRRKKAEEWMGKTGVLFVCFSLFAALCAWQLTAGMTVLRPKETVTITALNQKNDLSESQSVYLTGVVFENKKAAISASEENGWHYQDKWLVIRSDEYDFNAHANLNTRLTVPAGTARYLTFFTNRYKGLVQVDYGDLTQIADCYSEKDGMVGVYLPDSDYSALHSMKLRQIIVFTAILLVVNMLLAWLFAARLEWESDRSRKGELEFFRYVLSVFVVIYHFRSYGFGKEVPAGYLAVDVFFVISAFFLASHCYNKWDPRVPGERAAFDYFVSRVKSLFPHHAFSWLVMALLTVFLLKSQSIADVLQKGWGELFFLRGTGIGVDYDLNGVNWYLSTLLLASYFLYYMLCKHRKPFVHFIAPLLFLGTMGAIYNRFGNLLANNVKAAVFTWCTWRGIADMCLGCIAYELYVHLREKTFWRTRNMSILATIVEAAAWGIIIFQMLFGRNMADHVVPYLAVILILSMFLCDSYLSRLLNNSFSMVLGKLSFPVYLNQLIGIAVLKWICPVGPFLEMSVLLIIGVTLFSVFSHRLVKRITAAVASAARSFVSVS